MFARPAVRLARQTVGRRSASTNPDAIQRVSPPFLPLSGEHES